MKKVLFVSIVIMLISAMLISIIFIFKDKKEENEQEKIFEEITEIAKEKTDNKESIQEDTVNIKELYKINNDIIGWIKIEN